MAKLYIVATPIGNLKDISVRALHILEEVDFILCEDTRVTRKLLNYYNIKTPVESYHQHSNLKKINYIIDLLKRGKNLALVSDSGTPGISDPGCKLVSVLVNELGDKIEIISIPGPSAITAIASISGFPMDKFVFLGFPPHKKGRQRFFKNITDFNIPVIFYESPYRLLKSLGDLRGTYTEQGGTDAEPKIVVGKELTKKFEKIYRGTISKVIDEIEKDSVKGEYVVVINNKRKINAE
jgi:16S rRNA (cytidine1402-2'-O)-methyltransferase